ncbi:MAG: helix-turn-helix domain-containing protein [Candidatus Saelkia tenebricola]|nr:helix-turn-helix domain-containing protein [Candidatus Saelkia tenebricola]
MGKLLDVNELADYLKLDKQTIYNWLHKKKISGIKVGRVWRFDKDRVDEWLRSRVVPANPENKGEKNLFDI